MSGGLRYFGGAVAFGFAAVWIMASLAAALVCLLSAAVGYGAVLAADRMRARRAGRAGRPGITTPSMLAPPSRPPEVNDMPQWADVINSDLGHVYEPAVTTSRETQYGWPLNDDTATPSETLH